MLVQHLTLFRAIYQDNLGFAHQEYIELLRVFYPPIHRLFSHGPELWLHTLQASGERTALRNIFNDLALDLDNVSRQIQVTQFHICTSSFRFSQILSEQSPKNSRPRWPLVSLARRVAFDESHLFAYVSAYFIGYNLCTS